MNSQYETKYTKALMVMSVVTIAIFFFVDHNLIQSISFMGLTLLMSLNTYEAYLMEDKKKYKVRLVLSIIAFIMFTVFTIYALMNV